MKKILPWVFLISTLIILIILAIFIKNRPWSGYQETTIKPAEKISNIPVFYPNLFNNYLYYLDQENISISRVDLANGKISEIEDMAESFKDQGFDIIIHSPLKRAKQTAEIINKKLGK